MQIANTTAQANAGGPSRFSRGASRSRDSRLGFVDGVRRVRFDNALRQSAAAKWKVSRTYLDRGAASPFDPAALARKPSLKASICFAVASSPFELASLIARSQRPI